MPETLDLERSLNQLRDEQRRGFSDLNNALAEIRGHVARVHKRKELSEQTKRRHIAAMHRMGGMCPCCREVRIVDDSGMKLPNLQWDHWKAPGCNSVKATWAVCDACNSRLEDPLFKGRKQNCFASYQDFLLGPDSAIAQRDLFSTMG